MRSGLRAGVLEGDDSEGRVIRGWCGCGVAGEQQASGFKEGLPALGESRFVVVVVADFKPLVERQVQTGGSGEQSVFS